MKRFLQILRNTAIYFLIPIVAFAAFSVPQGGTGVGTLTGLVKGNGTSVFTAAVGDTDYQNPITLTTTGTSGAATLISDTLNIPQYSGGGGSSSIGGTITSGTAGSLLFVNPTATIAQANSNLYFQNSSTTPQQLATNTNVALSVNTSGDFSGTDAINAYGQYDSFLPNSTITNSLTGFNTDGAVPAYGVSSARGTGASPVELNTGDTVGGFFGFGSQGSSSPTYQNLGGMAVFTTGASTNNLGGELDFYTKADGGSLAKQLSISNNGLVTTTGNLAVGGASLTVNGAAIPLSVSNSDGTLTISPTTGAVVASLALGHSNTFTALQSVALTALGTVNADGLFIQNTTAAANNAQQVSPSLHLQGQAWKSNATAASEPVDWLLNVLPIQGTAAPTSTLQFQGSVNGGAYTNYLTITSNNTMVLNGSMTANSYTSGNTGTGFQSGNSLNTADIGTGGQQIIASQNGTGLPFGGAANVQMRVLMNGGTSTQLTASTSYANLLVGSSPVTMAATGTVAWLANAVINPLGTVTNGSAITVTNSASLYINGAGTGATNNYAFYVKGDIATAATQTVVNCSTSGTVTFSEPFTGPSYKQVIAYENACLGTASYTFPQAFTNTPDAIGVEGVKHTSISTSATTVTGTTTTGFSQLYGY